LFYWEGGQNKFLVEQLPPQTPVTMSLPCSPR